MAAVSETVRSNHQITRRKINTNTTLSITHRYISEMTLSLLRLLILDKESIIRKINLDIDFRKENYMYFLNNGTVIL